MGLFAGLPWPIALLFIITLCVVLLGHAWALLLFIKGEGAIARRPQPNPSLADEFLWVFLVPALNEEVTIADSVSRLRAVEVAHRLILVIDDGSTDRTPEILRQLAGPDLTVLRRELPNAQVGKAAALNDAWHFVGDSVLPSEEFAGFSRDQVIFVVVDADGRLDPRAPAYLAGHLEDPRVGGIQVGVRIYNRYNPLTWLQDIEFGVFGGLFQMGRTAWGTAGMGGNGQANRLTALDSVADAQGPWRDMLTEDQDVGIRLVLAGWRNVHDVRITVAQQGISDLRRLYRQRTRWSQGNMQAMKHLREIPKAKVSPTAKADLFWALLQPPLQGLVGVSTLCALVLAIFFGTPFFYPSDRWDYLWIVFLVFLAFGQTALGCMTLGRGHGIGGYLRGVITAIPYSFYAWLLWPIIVRAAWRILRGSTTWAKTAREPVDPDTSGLPLP